jgi:hypothetical protein
MVVGRDFDLTWAAFEGDMNHHVRHCLEFTFGLGLREGLQRTGKGTSFVRSTARSQAFTRRDHSRAEH